MKRKKTYISKNQLKKYGFLIDTKSQTDLKCYRTIQGLGYIRIFNYDYYTIRPDTTLIVNINEDGFFQGRCKNRQTFQKIMKQLKINRVCSHIKNC